MFALVCIMCWWLPLVDLLFSCFVFCCSLFELVVRLLVRLCFVVRFELLLLLLCCGLLFVVCCAHCLCFVVWFELLLMVSFESN